MILFLNFLKLFSFLQFVGRKHLDCMMCIQRDGGFRIFKVFRQSSGIALKRLKRKKCSTGERVEYSGSKSFLNSPHVPNRSPILTIPRLISLLL